MVELVANFEVDGTEEEFLEEYKEDVKKYELPSVTVDNVIFSYDKEKVEMKLLMIKRKQHPYQGKWALPGGFASPKESLEDSCIRELEEETGVKLTKDAIVPIGVYSTASAKYSQEARDPRGWVITSAYMALISEEELVAGDDAGDVDWVVVTRGEQGLVFKSKEGILEGLAFDHEQIVKDAWERLTGMMYKDLYSLMVLGTTFTMRESRELYSIYVGKELGTIDLKNHRRKLDRLVMEVGERKGKHGGRPEKVYSILIN